MGVTQYSSNPLFYNFPRMKRKNSKMIAAEMSPLDMIEGQERYVTVADVRKHFGMSRTTVWRSIDEGMPVLCLGRNLRRFRISEVQKWLEENGRERFARNGRRATVEALRR